MMQMNQILTIEVKPIFNLPMGLGFDPPHCLRLTLILGKNFRVGVSCLTLRFFLKNLTLNETECTVDCAHLECLYSYVDCMIQIIIEMGKLYLSQLFS